MPGSTVEAAMGEKALLLTGETFPADIAAFILGCDERVVVAGFAVAFDASDGRFFPNLRIIRFGHGAPIGQERV